MKKGLLIVLVFVLSFGFLQVANNLTTENATEPSVEGKVLTGTEKGYGGDVTVTVTLNGEDITAVEAVGADETQGVGSKAIEQLPELIIEADSAEVDGVTGATITSNAIKKAVNAALAAQ